MSLSPEPCHVAGVCVCTAAAFTGRHDNCLFLLSCIFCPLFASGVPERFLPPLMS